MYAKKKNPWLIILISVVCLTLVALGLFLYDKYVDRSGWIQKDGIYYYKDFHGKKVTGWQELEGNRYYFNDDYTMATGWLKLEGKVYRVGEDGALDYGWMYDFALSYFCLFGYLSTRKSCSYIYCYCY